MSLSSDTADCLRITARVRQRELKTRALIAVFGAGVLWVEAAFELAVFWLTLIACSQIIDRQIWRFAVNPSQGVIPSWKYALALGSAAQASFFYSLIGALLWFDGSVADRTFAYIWFAGSLLHVTLHMHHDVRAFLAGFVPHVLYFVGLPLLSLIAADPLPRASSAVVLLATLLYLGHLAVAFRTTRMLSTGLLKARTDAELRQKEAERANEAKSDFLARLSHEIRTPLNGIVGMAETLRHENLPEGADEKVAVLQDSSAILLRLLNDTLDLSKIESGKVELEAIPLDTRLIAEKVIGLYSNQAADRGTRLELVIEEGAQLRRVGDPLRLTQIISNLTSNALKFTEKGAVRVELGSAPNGSLRIRIRDTGIGMTADQIAVILEPFVQAENSTSRQYGGTGLGLAIVRGLVEAMDGTLEVDSMVGCGTSFIVDLPVEVDSQNEIAATAADPANDGDALVSLNGVRVLVVDDNSVNRMVLETMLIPTGVQVVKAEDGQTAVALAAEQEFDIVMMDITMPGMDGIEAMGRIRTDRERDGRVIPPIVAVSAHAMTHQINGYLQMGFSDYLTKPVSSAEVNRVLRMTLPKSAVAAA